MKITRDTYKSSKIQDIKYMVEILKIGKTKSMRVVYGPLYLNGILTSFENSEDLQESFDALPDDIKEIAPMVELIGFTTKESLIEFFELEV